VTPVCKQSKVDVKSKVSQFDEYDGVGVGQIVLKTAESKSGHLLVLCEGPKIIQVPETVKERHHLVVVMS
jgi:hypothetical protein